MGYILKAGGDLVKIETVIKASFMQTLASAPYTLTTTIKTGFTFIPVSAFIQVDGTTDYNTFAHCWIWQTGGFGKAATFGRTGSNYFRPNSVSSFIVNIDHGTTPANQFGVTVDNTRDFTLEMNIDDSSGDGNGKVTMYGYYVPDFIY